MKKRKGFTTHMGSIPLNGVHKAHKLIKPSTDAEDSHSKTKTTSTPTKYSDSSLVAHLSTNMVPVMAVPDLVSTVLDHPGTPVHVPRWTPQKRSTTKVEKGNLPFWELLYLLPFSCF